MLQVLMRVIRPSCFCCFLSRYIADFFRFIITSSCWALFIRTFIMLHIPSMELDSMWRSSTNMRPVTDLLSCTLDAKMPSFEFWIDFRRSLMYIMKSIGERTEPCRSPFWRKFGDDVSSPILYISLWNWYVLCMAGVLVILLVLVV